MQLGSLARSVGGALGVALGLGQRFVGAFAESLTNPATREGYYQANWRASNVVVSFDVASQLYYSHRITPGEFYTLCGYNGIEWRGWQRDDVLSTSRKAWKQAVDLAHPRADIDAYYQLWAKGLLSDHDYNARLEIAGITLDRDRRVMTSRPDTGTIQEFHSFWLQGFVSQETLDEKLHRNKVWDNDYWLALLKQRTPLSTDQIRARLLEETINGEQYATELQIAGWGRPGDERRATEIVTPHGPITTLNLWWRNKIGPERYNDLLRYNGLPTARLRDEFLLAARPIPGPSDLVRIAVKDAWDQTVVDRFGYDDEFPEPFSFWMKQQGYGWTEDVTLADGTVLPGVQWPKLFWRAHWDVLSPGQASELFYRNRPGREARYEELWPGLAPFTRDDLDAALKIHDYPPKLRGWLTAISSKPLGSRRVRILYIRRIRDRAWVRDQLLDSGLVSEDANALMDQWDFERDWERNRAVRAIAWGIETAVIKEAIAAYEAGLLTNEAAVRVMQAQGLSPDNADKLLQLAISRKARKYVTGVIRQLRRDFLLGATSPEEVGLLLLRGGVTVEEGQRLVQAWTLEKSLARRVQAAGWILDKVRRGLFPTQAAAVRLRNLGWSEPDIALSLSALAQDIARANARLQSSGDRARTSARKQLDAARRQAAAAQKAARAQLRQLYPKADLRRWLKEGIRSPRYVTNLLRQQGYTPDYVDAFIADALYVKPTRHPAAKATGQGEAPAPSSGTGAGQP